jgi:hypothetical protein
VRFQRGHDDDDQRDGCHRDGLSWIAYVPGTGDV